MTEAHIDIDRLIGRMVLEHEATKAAALAERRAFIEEINRLNGLVDKSNANNVQSDPAPQIADSSARKETEYESKPRVSPGTDADPRSSGNRNHSGTDPGSAS